MDVAFAAVLDAVRGGTISEERIDDSVRRVLLHKLRRGLFHPDVRPERAVHIVGKQRHLQVCRQVTDDTITLVRNEGGLLPLSGGTARKVVVAGWGSSTTSTLADAISARDGQRATPVSTGAVPSDATIDAACTAAREADLVVVTANAAAAGSEQGAAQARLVEALRATGTPCRRGRPQPVRRAALPGRRGVPGDLLLRRCRRCSR